jgi:hypothetical protein
VATASTLLASLGGGELASAATATAQILSANLGGSYGKRAR